jgi:hypothetical protein
MAENSLKALKEALARYGCPREILTKRETRFTPARGKAKGGGQSAETFFTKKELERILCQVSHLQINGKLDRFYGVYIQKRHQFTGIEEYARWHNGVKPYSDSATKLNAYPGFPRETTAGIGGEEAYGGLS